MYKNITIAVLIAIIAGLIGVGVYTDKCSIVGYQHSHTVVEKDPADAERIQELETELKTLVNKHRLEMADSERGRIASHEASVEFRKEKLEGDDTIANLKEKFRLQRQADVQLIEDLKDKLMLTKETNDELVKDLRKSRLDAATLREQVKPKKKPDIKDDKQDKSDEAARKKVEELSKQAE